MSMSTRAALAATLVLGVFASSAFAADLPKRAAPPAPVAPPVSSAGSWSGAYVGLHAGWANGSLKREIWAEGSGDGLRGGIHVGYNTEMAGVVVGGEVDLGYTSTQIKTSKTITSAGITATGTGKTDEDLIATGRLRLGYAMGNFMPYLTFGGAGVQVKDKITAVATNGVVAASATGNGTRMMYGYVAGGGVEMALTPQIGARLEYVYLDAPKQEVNSSGGKASLTSHLVTAGVNYRF
jgi:outer membrane immunogenic protein